MAKDDPNDKRYEIHSTDFEIVANNLGLDV